MTDATSEISPNPMTDATTDASTGAGINSSTGAALSVRGLGYSYDDSPHVLRDVDLEIAPGERVGLIGPNGAGKTTMFLLVCGVLRADVGDVVLFGEPVRAGRFHPDVGLVFQYPDDQVFSASVRDDIAFGPRNMALPDEEVNRRVAETMRRLQITDLADRAPHHLSGGQKRTVAIAGVQAMHPRLILYDEPSANLDIRSRRRLINTLLESNETYVVSSHDLELVLEVCERAVLVDEGQVLADGPASDVMADRDLMEAHGLECPHSLTHRHQHGV